MSVMQAAIDSSVEVKILLRNASVSPPPLQRRLKGSMSVMQAAIDSFVSCHLLKSSTAKAVPLLYKGG